MAPLRLIGKVSLQDEITMLETLRDKLLAVRGQARLIADSTGDVATRRKLECLWVHQDLDAVELCLFRAQEAQKEADAETGRVTLQEDLGRS